MNPSEPKTKSGEPYSAMYLTSFLVPATQKDGTVHMQHAKIACPASEFSFYQLIGGLNEYAVIDDLTRITAERFMLLEGYIHVD